MPTESQQRATNIGSRLLMVAAGVSWSIGGLLVRSQSVTDGWEIVFWRSLFMVMFMGGVLVVWHGRRAARVFLNVGMPGFLAGFFLSLTFFFFIISLTLTTVANTLVTMSMAPFATAAFGWFFLGETIAFRTWIAMGVAVSGIVVMFADSLSGSGWIGNLIAAGVPLAYACNLTLLRRAGTSVDMVPTVLIAGLVSIAIALPAGWPLSATPGDVAILAFMGVVQLGLGCLLMTIAARRLKAAEIGLFTLLETILGPVWVWLGIGEQPTSLALAGGAVVVGALAANELLGLRRSRAERKIGPAV